MIWWWLWLAAAAGENAAWPATDSRTVSGTSSAGGRGGGPGGRGRGPRAVGPPARCGSVERKAVHRDADALRASPESGGEVLFPRLLGQPAQQLEQLGQRRIGRNRDFVDGVQVEPLQQRISVDGRAVDRDTAVLRENDRALGLEQTRQRAKLRFLFLFGGGITEQLERA